MPRSALALVTLLVLYAAFGSAQSAPAQRQAERDSWVPTWGTAQQLIRAAPQQGRAVQPPSQAPTQAPAAPGGGSVGSPAAPPPGASPPAANAPAAGTPLPAPPAQAATGSTSAPQAPSAPAPAGRGGLQTLNNQTVRMIVRSSIGGRQARVKLSNAFGGAPVTIGSAHLARRAQGAAIVPESDRPLTFAGKRSFTLAPGSVVVSDAVNLDIPPLTDVAVSLYFPADTGPPTTHAAALRTTYISGDGDFSSQADIPDPRTTASYYWLTSIEVAGTPNASAVVAFGDSITDGARSTPDTSNTWPALLAARLAANKATAHISVINEGIGGNRVLTDAAGLAGVNALARLDRDVFGHPGVKWLMVLEGINDIGALANANAPYRATAEDLIWAYQQIITRAHAHGIKVIGCTLTPYGGAGYHTQEGEGIREAVNQWIRTSKGFDAFVDFDAAARDPANPKQLRAEYDPGDHLHPNDAGYRAMAEAIDLAMFNPKAGAAAPRK